MVVTEEQVLAMEDSRYAAMVDGDVAALDRMSADNLAYTHSSGVLDDKQSYMAAMRAGKFSYRRIERTEAGVVLLGGAGLVTGRIRLDVLLDTGPKLLDSRFMSVWIYFATGWKHLAWHSTGVPG